jgi:hypothetical protein
MKKIVLPFEGSSYHGELLDFVNALNKQSKLFLTAAFVPNVDYVQPWPSSAAAEVSTLLAQSHDLEKIAVRNCRRLGQFCETHSIGYRIHLVRSEFAVAAIRKETRFADLLLLSSSHFFDNISDRQPNAYMQKVLHDSECPVVLMPTEPVLPESIILAYDGSAGSVRAIRQFSRLFPEFAAIPATLVFVDEKGKGAIPDNDLIHELGNIHFRQFSMLRLSMTTDRFYDSWVGMMTHAWLVAGAYGRSDWSRLFTHSFVNRLIKEHQVPLFLTHC